MTDELTTMLAKVSTLQIVSRTSAMQFKDPHRSLPEVARALNVDGILEGSISRANGQVHMTLQLIRADTDTHIWAESYDRENNDVSTLPGEAARAIAKRLDKIVASSATTRYVNPEAHDAYLRGLYLWYNTSNEEAGRYFRKAVELQPDYAQGWAGVSSYLDAGAVMGELNPREALAPAEAAAIKAVQLDDFLPEAHLARSASFLFNRWDAARADKEVLRAIELDPKFAEAYHLRSKILQTQNRHDESIAVQKKSTELDPYARPWAMANALVVARQWDALNDLQLRLKSAPQDGTLLSLMFVCYHNKGMDAEAIKAYQKMLQCTGQRNSVAAVQRAFQRDGFRGLVEWELKALKEKAKTQYVRPTDLAALYGELGDREHALAFLEEGYRQHSPQELWIQSVPAFDFLHGEPRYRSIIDKMGLPPTY